MNTPIDRNDPRLLDYVMGELDTAAAEELTQALKAPENAEAREELAALRQVTGMAQKALQLESMSPEAQLTQSHRDTVLQAAQSAKPKNVPRQSIARRMLTLAAMLLFCVGGLWLYLGLIQPHYAWKTAQRQAETEEINQLKMRTLNVEDRGVQRFFVTDINNPGSAASHDPFNIDYKDPQARAELSDLLDTLETNQAVQDLERERRLAERRSLGRSVSTVVPEILSRSDADPMPTLVLPPTDMYYPGGEQYNTIQEQPFYTAKDKPLSTFSLHADSAAYTIVRRFLNQGQLPPADAVRIEDMINYFTYSYPQPVGPHPFSINMEVGPCPWTPGHLLVKVGLQGREVPQEERPPANLVFLIDTSGSMRPPNRLPLVRESLKALLENLNPDDRVGIVTYAGESRTALESTPMTRRKHIVQVIDNLTAGGSTHGSAGIQDAYAMAQEHFIEGGINRVILATDGDFNVGVTSREGLLSLIEEKRQTGVFLSVLGYGMGNLKDNTLELLSTKGNGNYAYIDDFGEARRVLVEQVSGTLMTIAKDVKIQVEFNPSHVHAYRLLGYENRIMAARDFHDDTKDAGEIGAGHTVTALYQIVPIGVPLEPGVDSLRYQEMMTDAPEVTDDSREMMFVKLRYKQPDSDTSRLIEIPVPARAVSIENTSQDFQFAVATAGFGLLLRNSAYKGDADFDMVRELATTATARDYRREDLLNLIVTAKTLRERR